MHEIFKEGWQWANQQRTKFLVAISITDPDTHRGTSKTCLDGGMHCPSAFSSLMISVQTIVYLVQARWRRCDDVISC